jgi:peptidoglycan/xylan/chitin deacetylase (PgdA/CDA1 family)
MNETQNRMGHKQVPLLITWDVDPDRWATHERRQRALSLALDLCEELGICSTFFITADFAHEYSDHLGRMRRLGQEIGCHGLTHSDEEDYDRMPEEMQRAYIEAATSKLQELTGSPVRAFRSPRVKISATTLRLLAEHRYLADSSVCSGRFDVISSNLINTGWLLAPRRPYHPHRANPFKRGDLPIWEVPLSALVVPFTSKVLNVLGLPATKLLFRLLYAESRRTGKPVVYLSHPTEFVSATGKKGRSLRGLFNRKLFSPRRIRTHGLLVRNALLRMDGAALFVNSRELFAYMASFPSVRFMNVSEYTIQDLHGASRSKVTSADEGQIT